MTDNLEPSAAPSWHINVLRDVQQTVEYRVVDAPPLPGLPGEPALHPAYVRIVCAWSQGEWALADVIAVGHAKPMPARAGFIERSFRQAISRPEWLEALVSEAMSDMRSREAPMGPRR